MCAKASCSLSSIGSLESRICSNRYRMIVKSGISQLSDRDAQEKVAGYDPWEQKGCLSVQVLYGCSVVHEE